LIRIKQEKAWLRQFLATEKPDAVISDNRYGLHAPGVFSVFITHQLHIRTPFGRLAGNLLQRLNYRAIRRFSLCWIPDGEGPGSLAGSLSHPERLPVIPLRYIGPLSRFERLPELSQTPAGLTPADAAQQRPNPESTDFPIKQTAAPCDLLILLSGPEPQRTIFEEKIFDQLPSYPGSVILVRGLPGSAAPLPPPAPTTRPERKANPETATSPERKANPETTTSPERKANPETTTSPQKQPIGERKTIPSARLQVYNHLPARELNTLINRAGIVLARAGYSTIMDLMKLGKKAILVPTPGQTEQEYLGAYLSSRQMVVSMEQSAFSLSGAMTIARDFPFSGIGADESGSRTDESDVGINRQRESPGDSETSRSAQPGGNDLLQREIHAFLEILNGHSP
jgi:hypothetical protein